MGKSVMKPEDLSKTLEEIQENITNALDALKELKTRELNIKKEFSELDSKYAEFVGWANQFETTLFSFTLIHIADIKKGRF